MKIKCSMLIITQLLIFNLSAQYPFNFTELAHYDPDNYSEAATAYDVVVSDDSLIFSSFGEQGLYVHRLAGSKLQLITHIQDGNVHRNLMIAHDGSILSALLTGGVRAYKYHEGHLTQVAMLDTTVITHRMIKGPDSTVFFANGSAGLYAYKYTGDNFEYITSDTPGGQARGLAFHPDSTVFVANKYGGIRLYKFTGSEFLLKSVFRITSEDECFDYHAMDVTLVNDSTLASCGSQINIYHYSDSCIYETYGRYLPMTNPDPYDMYNYGLGKRITSKGDSIFVSVENEGLYYCRPNTALYSINYKQSTSYGTFVTNNNIFHTNGEMGLSVYDRDLSLMDMYSLSEYSTILKKGSDNMVFVASGIGGVKAMEFEEGEFHCVAKAGVGENVIDVAVSDDGRIISTVNKSTGLKVYEFSDNEFDLIYRKNYDLPVGNAANWVTNFSTEISSDNKIYFGYSYRYDDLLHDYNDYSAGMIASFNINGSTITYNIDSDFWENNKLNPLNILTNGGNIFVSFNTKGIKELTNDTEEDVNGNSSAMDISENGVIYLANGYYGIRSYSFNTEFHEIAHFNNDGFVYNVCAFGNNLLFTANGVDGFSAYTHIDSIFTCRAHMEPDNDIYDIIVMDDSTLIVSEGYGGLRAYNYNGWSELTNDTVVPDIPAEYVLVQNYPNPFNPTTTISFQLPVVSDIQMIIFDIFGRKIKQWSFQDQVAGSYNITWNGKDQAGNPVPSGVYIYSMKAEGFIQSRKMVILK